MLCNGPSHNFRLQTGVFKSKALINASDNIRALVGAFIRRPGMTTNYRNLFKRFTQGLSCHKTYSTPKYSLRGLCKRTPLTPFAPSFVSLKWKAAHILHQTEIQKRHSHPHFAMSWNTLLVIQLFAERKKAHLCQN